MRKFTLTAIAIKDEKVVGVFKVLEQTPKFDGALLSCALSKFVELQYQELVFDPSKVVFADLHWLRSNFGKLSVDELAFSVWRAATALRNSNALEVEGVKHGSNWLVKLDDEPFEVKFVLEDQAQNYLILNSLPALESTVLINDSGWLATAAPEDKFSNEFGDKGVVVESGSGMFEKPISEGYAESLSEVLEQVDQSRSASKALLGE